MSVPAQAVLTSTDQPVAAKLRNMLFRAPTRTPEESRSLPIEPPVIADLLFEALLTPHRSLSRRGSFTLSIVVATISVVIALRFWFIGAWPVMAFSLVEIMFAGLLLAINLRRARAREVIKLSASEIMVIQTDHKGRRNSFSLPAAWLQVRLETAENCCSRLLLSSRGAGREVGAFLHEPEKLSLFEALRDTLQILRQPRFDNEQLREG